MDKVTDIAKYMACKYYEITKEPLDEKKLHYLLYFAQRESFALLGKPMFKCDFRATEEGIECANIKNNVKIKELCLTSSNY